MSATFNRIKDWIAEVLTYEDLNAEIDNILENLGPAGIGDYSANLAQYQETESPIDSGGVAALPTSLAGEIERLRYQIQAIMGTDVNYWYDAPTATLSGLSTIVFGNSVPSSRIESIDSDSYVNLLIPSGSTTSLTLKGSTNTIVYYVGGVRYELDEDITISGMSAAPSTQNTALVTETAESATHASSYLGEHGTTLLIGTVGTNISATNNRAAFRVVSGGNTEYFTAQYLNDATDGAMLEKAERGCFFTSTGASSGRTTIATGDTVTLQRLAWIYIKNDNTLTLTYNTPTYSFVAPTSPSIGDFWFDLDSTTWKSYTALGFEESNAVLIGQAIVSSTACVAARSVEPFRIYANANEVEIEALSASSATLTQKSNSARISVYAVQHNFGYKNQSWGAGNLESGVSLANNTTYYAYVKESGDAVLSTLAPNNRVGDLAGFYHPANSWRCVGYGTTNGSAAFTQATIVNFSLTQDKSFFSNDNDSPGAMKFFADNTASSKVPKGWKVTDGTTLSRGLYRQLRDSRNAGAIGSQFGTGDGSTTFTLPQIGAATGVWQTYTSTVAGNWGANSTTVAEYRRVNDTFEARIVNQLTAGASNSPTFTMLSGLTENLIDALSVNPVGSGYFLDSSTGNRYPLVIVIASGSNLLTPYYYASVSNITQLTNTAPVTVATGDLMTFTVSLRATGWTTTDIFQTIKTLR